MILDIHDEISNLDLPILMKINEFIIDSVGNKEIGNRIYEFIISSRMTLCTFFNTIYYFRLLCNNRNKYISRLDIEAKDEYVSVAIRRKFDITEKFFNDEYLMFVVCTIITCKYIFDTIYNNKYWAKMAETPVELINEYERCTLEIADYDLTVDSVEYKKIINEFRRILGKVRMRCKVDKGSCVGFGCILGFLSTKFSCLD
ncbi:hypothetical protein TCON_2277 [Astathelohania contejeani]|uniref:Uncharacterized protein n=1 Tax=Astathelohania contejeani TaxID=164912 RepID=A0ABQ7HWH0_9MICR|nr:hypothetical protein TCON_2277 [Thelohania contejeani]